MKLNQIDTKLRRLDLPFSGYSSASQRSTCLYDKNQRQFNQQWEWHRHLHNISLPLSRSYRATFEMV